MGARMVAHQPKGCKPGPADRFVVQIDRNRCEGKAACVHVCPRSVFEIQRIGDSERAGLSWLGRLKAWAHGGKQAFAVRAADCDGCRQCVIACPERAITVREKDDG